MRLVRGSSESEYGGVGGIALHVQSAREVRPIGARRRGAADKTAAFTPVCRVVTAPHPHRRRRARRDADHREPAPPPVGEGRPRRPHQAPLLLPPGLRDLRRRWRSSRTPPRPGGEAEPHRPLAEALRDRGEPARGRRHALPHDVLATSGHVERFNDFIVKDSASTAGEGQAARGGDGREDGGREGDGGEKTEYQKVKNQADAYRRTSCGPSSRSTRSAGRPRRSRSSPSPSSST